MTTLSPIPSPRQQALGLLLDRHSAWPLVAPAPTDEELELVFAAALRAPDHGRLQPWRFMLVRQALRPALGDVYARVALAAGQNVDPERARAKAMAAPMIIAVAARLQPSHAVPEFEQMLSAGAATMNMLNALHILGYGGFWKSVPGGPEGPARTILGFDAHDQVIGMLYIGTPKEPRTSPRRLNAWDFVQEWQCPTA